MRNYSELELIAQAAVGFSDVSLAPDVVLELIAENKRLRAGMKGDYDLDAWLDWTREAEAMRKAMHELANHPKLTASQAEILRAAMTTGEQP